MGLKLAKLANIPTIVVTEIENPLLQDQPWTEDVNFLNEAYNDIVMLSENPQPEETQCQQVDEKLLEIIVGLQNIAPQLPAIPQISQLVAKITKDFRHSGNFRRKGKVAHALNFQSISLARVRRVLNGLTVLSHLAPHFRNANAIEKLAYGYDISGEVYDGSSEIANRENQTNVNDTAQPQDGHMTPPNPANLTGDADAETEFPSLLEKKNDKVVWPPRIR